MHRIMQLLTLSCIVAHRRGIVQAEVNKEVLGRAPRSDESSGGLGLGPIIGIAGGAVGLVLLALLAVLLLRCRTHHRDHHIESKVRSADCDCSQHPHCLVVVIFYRLMAFLHENCSRTDPSVNLVLPLDLVVF